MLIAFVYILECSDGTLYTGWTWNAHDRLRKHNEGKGSKYVRSRLPAKLRYVETLPDKSAAMSREAEIKKMTRADKLWLIERGRRKHNESRASGF